MKKITGILLGMFLLMTVAEAAPEKKIYAHYMGCWPAGYSALQWYMGEFHKTLDHRSEKYTCGGRIVNWALIPLGVTLTPEQNAELEIKRAIRAGIDGFVIDAWAGGGGAKKTMGDLIAAAERMKVPFGVTICLDPSCQPQKKSNLENFTDSIRFLLKYKNSPNIARRNGKVLVFGYHSSGILSKAERERTPDGPERWERYAEAYRTLRKNVGEPLFLHYCIDSAYHVNRKDKMFERFAEWCGKNFDAVGGFIGEGWFRSPEFISAVKKGGAEWSQPMFYQYHNKKGGVLIGNGLDNLRTRWKSAIDSDSPLIQFVTWNDYGEESNLAPGYATNYTVTRINRYYSDLWKSGKVPEIKKDELHLVFRRQLNGIDTFPFAGRRPKDGVLEVISLLTENGQVELPDYGITYDAPAGLFYKQFPLRKGKVRARLKRGFFKSTELEVTAPEEVTDKPWREDFTMAAFGSNFMDEWKADFGDLPPLLYSENGDIDGDGLPNWFEMYYFGKFPLMNTAASANPQDDPDKDGFTNLQEYLNQTDPKRAERSYRNRYVWSLEDLILRNYVFNPQRDKCDRPVWFFLHRYRKTGTIEHDGNYRICVNDAPWQKNFGSGNYHPEYGYGSEMRITKKDAKTGLYVGGRPTVLMVFGWKSPVDGIVSVQASVSAGMGSGKLTVELAKNGILLERKELKSGEHAGLKADRVSVKKGDFLYFIPDFRNAYFHGGAFLEKFTVKLERME